MKKSIFIRALKTDINIIRVSFIIVLITIAAISFKSTVNIYRYTSEMVTRNFLERDSIIRSAISTDTSSLPQIAKLKEQYKIIEPIKKAFLYNAVNFNAYGYTFTIFFAIFSIITAILTFLILRNGWEGTNNYYLKSSFMILFFLTSLFKILPGVFDNKTNTKNNFTRYNYYFGLQVHIYDLLKDNKGFIKRGNPDSLDNYISAINKNIIENQDLYFDIYTDKIPGNIKPLGD